MEHRHNDYLEEEPRQLFPDTGTHDMYEEGKISQFLAYSSKPHAPTSPCETPKMTEVPTSSYHPSVSTDDIFPSHQCINSSSLHAAVHDVFTPPAGQSGDLGNIVDSVITPAQPQPPLPDLHELKLPENVSDAQHKPPPNIHHPSLHRPSSCTSSEVTTLPPAPPLSPLSPVLPTSEKHILPSSESINKILALSNAEPVKGDAIDKLFNDLCEKMKVSAKYQKLQLREKLKDESKKKNENGTAAQISSRREAKVSRELKNAYQDLCEHQLRDCIGYILNLYAAIEQYIDLSDEETSEMPREQPKKRRKRVA